MVAAGSGALLFADVDGSLAPSLRDLGIMPGWTASYLLIAAAAALPLPILASLPRDPEGRGARAPALLGGLATSAVVLLAFCVAVAAIGSGLLGIAAGSGIDAKTNVTPWVLGLAMLPFVLMAAALPKIRASRADSPLRTSVALGPYVDFFWRYGFATLVLMAFVSVYRMGDVLALNLSKPMILALGYTKTEIGWADGLVALASSIIGVGLGGWMTTRFRFGITLTAGATFAAIGNFGFVWLAHQPHDQDYLYLATAADQFGNGMAGAIFVVYLSMLVNPRYAGSQYAFLSGFAFLLSRLLSGAGGTVVSRLDAAGYNGFDLFFLASGIISLAAVLFLPVLARVRPRTEEA
jgi:PAT family beta-lactamase induction signal transducer AmpG